MAKNIADVRAVVKEMPVTEYAVRCFDPRKGYRKRHPKTGTTKHRALAEAKVWWLRNEPCGPHKAIEVPIFEWATFGGNYYRGEVVEIDSNVLYVLCEDGVTRAV